MQGPCGALSTVMGVWPGLCTGHTPPLPDPPTWLPIHKTVIFGFSVGLRPGRSGVRTTPPDPRNTLLGVFDPSWGVILTPKWGYLTPIGPLARQARPWLARTAVSIRARSEIGGLDQDFWPKNRVFDTGCHPRMDPQPEMSRNWCYRSGF